MDRPENLDNFTPSTSSLIESNYQEIHKLSETTLGVCEHVSGVFEPIRENAEGNDETDENSLLGLRTSQVQLLLERYEGCSSADATPELVLITGASGSGKTTLATSIRSKVLTNGGFFMVGKFSHSLTTRQQARKPFVPFMIALSELAIQLQHQNQDTGRSTHQLLNHLQDSIQNEGMQAELQFLAEEIPSLYPVMGNFLTRSSAFPNALEQQQNHHQQQQEQIIAMDCSARQRKRPSSTHSEAGHSTTSAQQQYQYQQILSGQLTKFAVVFKRFLRLLCASLDACNHAPLVFLLDDAQWIDAYSLELLQQILTSLSEFPRLFVMGTCRSNEVTFKDPLSEMLRNVEDSGVNIVEVRPPTLDVHTVCHMIEKSLPRITRPAADPSKCHALAQRILEETNGNFLFAQKFIEYSRLEEALLFEKNEPWPAHGVIQEEKEVGFEESLSNSFTVTTTADERMIQWLARQMRGLPDTALFVLQVIACLGGTFDANLLQRCSRLDLRILEQALQICCEHQFLWYAADSGKGSFRHDKYQEAAQACLPASSEERARLYMQLGQNLFSSCTSSELDEFILSDKYAASGDSSAPKNNLSFSWTIMVDLMLAGKGVIRDESDREKLAMMCLRAGRYVARSSVCAASSASDYFQAGIELLGRRHWRDQYELSSALFNSAAELAYCQGHHNRVKELVAEIKTHARSFMDQIQACMTLTYSLGAEKKQDEAIEEAFDALQQLGHPFPRNLAWLRIQHELYQTRRALRKRSKQDILSLPMAEDRKALLSMSIIQVLHPIVATSRHVKYAAITGSRLVRLTLQYGLSSMSSIGFALYGLTLVRLGQFDEGHHYGQIALELMHTLECRECESKIFMTLGNGPLFVKLPLTKVKGLFERGFKRGLQTGDTESALRNLMCFSIFRFLNGDLLSATSKSIKETMQVCQDYGSLATEQLLVSCDNLCCMLSGCRKEQSQSMDSKHLFRLSEEVKIDSILVFALSNYCTSAMFMDDLKLAGQALQEVRKRRHVIKSLLPFAAVYQIFCEGVLAATMGKNDRRKLRMARKRLSRLKKLEAYNPANYANKVLLIEAQLKASAGKRHEALGLYDSSIEAAKKQGFIHEEALAYEKAGKMLLEGQRNDEAKQYLSNARRLYATWGANSKVAQLNQLLKVV